MCDAMLEAARAGATYARRRGRRARRGRPGRGARRRAGAAGRGPARGAAGRRRAGRRARRSARPRRAARPARTGRAGDRRPGGRRASTRAGTRSSSRSTSRSRRRIRISSHYPFDRVNAAPGVRPRGGARLPPRPAGGRLRRLGAGRDEDRAARALRRRSAARNDDPPLRAGVPGALRRRRPATGSASATPTCGSASARTARHAATSRSGATRRTSAAAWRSGTPRPDRRSSTSCWRARSSSTRSIGVVKADIGIKDGRIAGIGRAGSPEISDGIDLVIGPHTKSFMAYGLDRHPGRRRHPRPHDQPRAPAARAVGRRHDADHGRLRGAAVRDGADARGPRGLAGQRRHAGGRASDRGRSPRRAGRGGRAGLQDPRGQRGLPGADRPRPALRRRPRPDAQPPHRRAAGVGGARGHRRGDRRPDRPRLPRRGHGRRPRAGPAGPRPRAVDPVLVDDAHDPVRGAHGRRARAR